MYRVYITTPLDEVFFIWEYSSIEEATAKACRIHRVAEYDMEFGLSVTITDERGVHITTLTVE